MYIYIHIYTHSHLCTYTYIYAYVGLCKREGYKNKHSTNILMHSKCIKFLMKHYNKLIN